MKPPGSAGGLLVTTWTSATDGTQYQYTAASASATTGTLEISHGSLTNGDVIVIDNFNLAKAGNSLDPGYLGIHLLQQTAVVAGTPTGSVTFGATLDAAVTATGTEQTITIYASTVSTTAQTVTLNANGASGNYYVSLGSGLESLSGPVTLTIPAGQDSVTVNLIDATPSPQAQTVELTATLEDGSSTAAVSNTLSVTFAATAAASGSTVVSGVDEQIRSGSAPHDPVVSATVYQLDGGNDQITAGSGINIISAEAPGLIGRDGSAS